MGVPGHFRICREPLLSAPRPADAGRPPWGSSKVAKPHLLECAPRPADAGRPPWGSSKVAKPHLLECIPGPCRRPAFAEKRPNLGHSTMRNVLFLRRRRTARRRAPASTVRWFRQHAWHSAGFASWAGASGSCGTTRSCSLALGRARRGSRSGGPLTSRSDLTRTANGSGAALGVAPTRPGLA